MSNFLEDHFSRVTIETAKDWMSYVDPINVFSSASGIKLGVNTSGDWLVEDFKGRHLFMHDVGGAIEAYKQAVRDEQSKTK